jgi:hypothetical protein
MDSQNTPLGDGMDWNDPMFNTADQFTDHMNSDSTFNSAFDSYTHMNDFADSPGGLQMRQNSKPANDYSSFTAGASQDQINHIAMPTYPSREASSQDSSSDTSSGRKRKTASESPMSEADRIQAGMIRKEDSMIGADVQHMAFFGANQKPVQGMNIQTSMADNSIFDFSGASSTSSPINATTFDTAMSLDSQMQSIAMQNAPQQFKQESPVSLLHPLPRIDWPLTFSTDTDDQSCQLHPGRSFTRPITINDERDHVQQLSQRCLLHAFLGEQRNFYSRF